MTIGEFIKQKRIAKGLTIEQLSKLCNSNDSAFSRIENNKRDVEFSLLTTLCKVLDFTPNELASITGFSSPEPAESNIEEIIEKTARATSEETINRMREKYRTPLFLQQFNEFSELVKKGRQMEEMEKEELIPIEGSLPVKITNKTIKYPVISDKIACGYSLIPAEDEVDDWIELPEIYAVNAEIVLRAKGDCLDNEKIHDGYLVFIKCQNTAFSGDIVAVRVIENSHGHAILKKLRMIKGHMFLTDKSDEIIEFNENMSIIGKAIYWMPDPRKFA